MPTPGPWAPARTAVLGLRPQPPSELQGGAPTHPYRGAMPTRWALRERWPDARTRATIASAPSDRSDTLAAIDGSTLSQRPVEQRADVVAALRHLGRVGHEHSDGCERVDG